MKRYRGHLTFIRFGSLCIFATSENSNSVHKLIITNNLLLRATNYPKHVARLTGSKCNKATKINVETIQFMQCWICQEGGEIRGTTPDAHGRSEITATYGQK